MLSRGDYALDSLNNEEIRVIERYIKEHWDEVMEEDRRIEERRKTQKNSPEIERILLEGRAKRLALMKQLDRKGPNGEPK